MKSHNFIGKVIEGGAVGGKFGVATANLEVTSGEEYIPPDGVYIVDIQKNGDLWHGVMFIGERKTFGLERSIEVHILDFAVKMYGQELAISVRKFLRPVEQFASADALFTQIENDVTVARKYFLRQKMMQRWSEVASHEKQEWSERAAEMLMRYEPLKNAQKVGIYAPDERYEIPFVQQLCSALPEKTFYFPREKGVTLELVESRFEDLEVGKWGILSPTGNNVLNGGDLDLLFVPALALDHQGNRLGRGKGYYDRFLENKSYPTISIVPEFAYLDFVPTELYDHAVDSAVAI